MTPRALQRGSEGAADLVLVATLDGPPLAEWSWTDAAGSPPTCVELPTKTIELGDQTRTWLVLTARGGSVALDRTSLRAR